MKKLKLHRETVRKLADGELLNVNGRTCWSVGTDRPRICRDESETPSVSGTYC